jgi:hypothetical protein
MKTVLGERRGRRSSSVEGQISVKDTVGLQCFSHRRSLKRIKQDLKCGCCRRMAADFRDDDALTAQPKMKFLSGTISIG